jgi:hypothetical protein
VVEQHRSDGCFAPQSRSGPDLALQNCISWTAAGNTAPLPFLGKRDKFNRVAMPSRIQIAKPDIIEYFEQSKQKMF